MRKEHIRAAAVSAALSLAFISIPSGSVSLMAAEPSEEPAMQVSENGMEDGEGKEDGTVSVNLINGEASGNNAREIVFAEVMTRDVPILKAVSTEWKDKLQELKDAVPEPGDTGNLSTWFSEIELWADKYKNDIKRSGLSSLSGKMTESASSAVKAINSGVYTIDFVNTQRTACLGYMQKIIDNHNGDWELLPTGTLQIWHDDALEAHTWTDTINIAEIKRVEFTQGYKPVRIYEEAFIGCRSLTTFYVMDTVVEIQPSAFEGCTSLSNLYLNNSLLVIGEAAFKGCTSIRALVNSDGTMPANITTIGASAFEGCRSLQKINMGNTVLSVGDSAFKDCTSLQQIKTDKNLADLGDNAFMGCTSLKDVEIVAGDLKTIGSGTFSGCTSLTSITIPQTVATIKSGSPGTFEDCKYLRAIDFTPVSTLAVIGDNAFRGCEVLEELNIPDSVSTIGESAYQGCNTLTTVDLGENITSLGASAFADCINLITAKVNGNLTKVPEYAFSGCIKLESLTLEEEITEIGSGAFMGCVSLKEAAIPASVLYIYGEDGAFSNCTALESVTFPENAQLKEIRAEAFMGCSALKEITLPSQLVIVGDSAFAECISLRKIYGGGMVTTIGTGVFTVSSNFDYDSDGDGEADLKSTVYDRTARRLRNYPWAEDGRIFGVKAFLDPQGGRCSKDSITAIYGQKIGNIPAPKKDRYYFDGWYTLASGGVKVVSTNMVTATDDYTLYAHWLKLISVKFDPQGGTCKTVSADFVYSHAYGELPVPELPGKVFLGWYTDKETGTRLTKNMIVSSDKDFTAYAHWSDIIAATVFFDAQGGTFKGEKTKVVIQGKKYGAMPTPEYSGHTFTGWHTSPYQGELITEDTVVAVNSDKITLYAQWDKDIASDSLSVNQADYNLFLIKPGKTVIPLNKTEWSIYPGIIIDKIYVSDKKIAKVKESATENALTIKPKKKGTVNIVVESADGKTELYQIIIEKPVLRKKALKVKHIGAAGTVSINQAYYLNTVYLKPTNVTSSDTVVAEIAKDGTIWVKKPGKAKIICYFGKKKVKGRLKAKR